MSRLLSSSALFTLGAVLLAPCVANAQTTSAGTEPPTTAVGEIVVTARRSVDGLVAPSHQITRLDRETIEAGRAVSDTLSGVLAKVVPGLADSSRTITDYGQTLRGRGALILVDGVPYNTNRDSSRNLISVDPANVQQVEVLRGGSALYGSGATGGIISINTRPAGGPLRAETIITGVSSLSHPSSDGLGGRIQQFVSGSSQGFDFAVNGGWQHIGAGFDGNGDRRAPEPSQGDLFDSEVWSLGGKLGRRIGDDGYLQGALNWYRAEQDSDYAADPAVGQLPAGAANARPLKGLVLAEQNQVRSTVATLAYRDRDLWGSDVSVLGYYRDLFTRFTPFDARGVATRGRNVDQVFQNSEVAGARLTINTPLAERTALTWGGDVNREVSDMPLDVFDPAAYDASGGLVFNRQRTLIYMPELTTRTEGVFAQLQHRLTNRIGVEAGVRYDRAKASFDSFTPLSQSQAATPYVVQGGTIDFDAWTFNAGATWEAIDGHEFYASFSQGFQLPDIGLQLRNAGVGFSIDNSDLEPVKIDSYEAGWRGRFDRLTTSIAAFRTTSDLGDVQSFNNGLILLRTAERINGVEATIDFGLPQDVWRFGGAATYLSGHEKAATAVQSRDMTGYRIPPLKVTAYVEYAPGGAWDLRLQALHSAEHDYRLNGVASFGRREVKAYTVVDLIGRYRLSDRDQVTVGVENLLNAQYLPVYSQLLRSNTNTSRVPANGATLSLSLKRVW
ncbi:Ferric aerobactin receptor precursor [compost metagenome]